mmetsp:Transcript_9911/g.18715  ORF Transcript_9911/g.18715 Transcript_9911/m.18715 type:complete len:88 (+) Transcript_9911:202-465(+)
MVVRGAAADWIRGWRSHSTGRLKWLAGLGCEGGEGTTPKSPLSKVLERVKHSALNALTRLGKLAWKPPSEDVRVDGMDMWRKRTRVC